ncbi:MAG TPA: MFS transporter [Phycisphaerae bacterium]|nr:MFS transporter [Phycisphaerae bacterium]
MTDPSQRIPLHEKLGYSAADAAANFVFMSMILFQGAFYTDVMGLGSGVAALVILVPRLWDAFFDPIMGALADRTRTRWGRFRPWILWTALPWGVVLYLSYTVPSFSGGALVAYAVLTNSLLMTLYSANNMPYSALGGVMSADIQERAKLNSFRFIAVNAAQFIVQGFTLVWVSKFAGLPSPGHPKGDLAHGWSVVYAFYAILCVTCFLITFATTRERVQPVQPQESSIRQDFRDLLRNSPWAVMFFMTLIHFTILAFRGGAEYQYYQLYADKQAMFDFIKPLGLTAPALAPNQPAPGGFLEMLGYVVHADPAHIASSNVANAVYGLAGMIGKLVTILAILFSAPLAKRFGKKSICVAGFALMIVNSFAFYFLKPADIGLMILLTITGSLFYAPTIPLLWAIFADVADYSEWKTGRRATGTIFATIGFALKAGLAIGAYGLLEVQASLHYDPNAITPEIVSMFRICTSLVPAILFAMCTLLLLAYRLDKERTLQMADELAARRVISPSFIPDEQQPL